MNYSTDHTFIDKLGRSISFEIDYDITAHVNNVQIGEVQFNDLDGDPILFNMFVDSEYQRAGIATEMIRLAADVHGRNFGRPSFSAQGGSSKGSSEYFTIEGAALFSYCIAHDIIDDLPDPYDVFEDDGTDA